uniref:F-ATPase protein 6 n=1 Tax=Populus trichocarpa TaxID=3694 RepID=A0A2K1XIA5_POPTR
MKIGDLYFSFTNPSFFMLLTLSLVLLLVHFVTKKGGGTLVPNAWQSLVEFLYDFPLFSAVGVLFLHAIVCNNIV